VAADTKPIPWAADLIHISSSNPALGGDCCVVYVVYGMNSRSPVAHGPLYTQHQSCAGRSCTWRPAQRHLPLLLCGWHGSCWCCHWLHNADVNCMHAAVVPLQSGSETCTPCSITTSQSYRLLSPPSTHTTGCATTTPTCTQYLRAWT